MTTTTLSVEPELYKFSVEEYERMIELGIIPEQPRVELIEGVIYQMAAHNSAHFAGVIRASDRLRSGLGRGVIVTTQGSIRLSTNSEPETDVMVLRFREDEYEDALPTPADVHLLVEVADSSLARDRDVKMDLYARAGIVESWLLSPPEDRLRVYRDPSPAGYRSILVLTRGETVAPLAFPAAHLAVADLLGRGKAAGRGRPDSQG